MTDRVGTFHAMSKIFGMSVASVYVHYVNKVERKGRTVDEVDQVTRWLTGFSQEELQQHLHDETSFENFFAAATINPNAALITGSICGYKVQEIEDPLMQQIRWMDKLVDELAKGKKLTSILRAG